MTPEGEFALEGLASMTSCAYLYTCPFWISVELYLRERNKSTSRVEFFQGRMKLR